MVRVVADSTNLIWVSCSPVVMLVGFWARRDIWSPLAAPRPKWPRKLDLSAGAGQRHLNLRVCKLHLKEQIKKERLFFLCSSTLQRKSILHFKFK